MRTLLCILLATIVSGAYAENTRISVEGTLLRDETDGGEEWLVRAADSDFTLRFVDDSVRRFVVDSGLAGAQVKVQGELRVNRAENNTALIIVADTIVSPANKAAVAVGRPAPRMRAEQPRADLRADERVIDTSVDDRRLETESEIVDDTPATTRARDISRVERRQLDVLDIDSADSRRGNIRYNRVARRDRDIIERKNDRPDGPDVIMLPGGGAIIRNNP